MQMLQRAFTEALFYLGTGGLLLGCLVLIDTI